MIAVPLLDVAPLAGNAVSRFDGTRRYLATGSLTDDSLEPVPVTWETKPDRANLTVQEGDVAFARMMETTKVLGVTAEYADLILSTGFAVLRPKRGRLDPGYLRHFLRSPAFQARKDALCAGATQKALTNEGLAKLAIPVPLGVDSVGEQHRIASILDKAEDLHRKREHSVHVMDGFVRSTFIEMFGNPVKNSKGWRMETVGQIAPGKGLIVDGPFGSSMKPDCYVEAGVRVIRNVNIRSGQFDMSRLKFVTIEKFQEVRRSAVESGDMLISTKGSIGDACLLPSLGGPSVLSATGTVRVRIPAGSPVLAGFVLAQVLLPEYQRVFRSIEAGSNQKYLNLAAIRRMPVIAPPIDLQQNFLAMVGKVDEVGGTLKRGRLETKQLFRSLLHRAFRGEL